MSFALRLKHWQIFGVIVLGLLVNNFTVADNLTLTIVLRVTGILIYCSWGFLVGHGLYQLVPDRIDLNYNLFLIHTFVWLTAYMVIMVISNGEGMTFTGVAALSGFYVFYAFLHYLMFPVRALKSIEKNRKADIGECIGDFFLVVFLPIGIWFLQPRINRVAKSTGLTITK
jgi:hypothetical protein